MKKILGSILFGLAVMLVSSCSSSSSPTITEQAFNNCFAYVTDNTTGLAATYKGMGYQLRLNYTDVTADVVVTGLQLPDGTQYPTFSLNGMKWKFDEDGWIVVRGTGVTPVMQGFGSAPMFDTFELRLFGRVLGGQYSPGFSVRYTVNTKFSVTSSFYVQRVYGETESTNPAVPGFKTTNTYYDLAFNVDTRSVTVTMYQAEFAQGMRALDIVLENIPFTITGTTARFNASAITPKIGKVPYENFPITNLVGEFDFAEGLELEFDCKPGDKMPGVFHVEADCPFAYSGYDDKDPA